MNNNIGISGSLKFITLGDLMQLIGTNGSTGVLKIMNKYAEAPGCIFFSEGKMVDAEADTKKGVEAVYALFGWLDGEFAFSVEAVTRENSIKENRMEIILNGLRMLDDGATPKLGPVQYQAEADGKDKKSRVPTIKGPLIDYGYVVDEDTYDSGSAIVEQGKHGGWIWVILEGVVEIVKQTNSGPVTILQLGAGTFIGSISTFLMQGAARSATARAVGEVQLGVLDSQLLSKEYSMFTAKMKDVILSMDKRLKSITNIAVDTEVLDTLRERFDEGERVEIEHDDYKDGLHLISRGEVYMVAQTPAGPLSLMVLEEGDFIGKIPFLDFGYHHEGTTYYRSEDFEADALNLEMLQNEYNRLSVTFKNIIDNMVACLSVTTNIALDYVNKHAKIEKTVTSKE